ncbi:MAG: radical SAM family heme chaperone HemW, partial [Lachnospiraceae bacterium]|nr:radical SAM family heme chaperone HemW [Lachnospiraceae bacterium]
GGGTPSWLELPIMERILETAHTSFDIDPQAEFSIEVNPGTADVTQFRVYRALGINRISIGLQSANDDELRLLGRIHDYNRFLHTYEYARSEGFTDINVDIMTGLPGQTPAKLLNTLRQVTRLFPTHISAYALMIEEGTPFYDRYKFDAVRQHAGMETEELPNEDQEYELSKCAEYELSAAGYGRYEISNYSKEGYECAHNLGYWRRVPYMGVGLGAASLIGETRSSNVRDIYTYMDIAAGKEATASADNPFADVNTVTRLSRREQMEEFFFLGLRTTEGVYRRDFIDAFGLEPEPIYGEVMNNLVGEGLLEIGEGRIVLTEKGMDLANYALAQFIK